MHQRLHNLSEGVRGKNKLSGVQCFSIQEGREEMSPESGMVLTDHSPSPEVFRRPKEAKLMRWHAERKKPDDGDDPKLRHVEDGS